MNRIPVPGRRPCIGAATPTGSRPPSDRSRPGAQVLVDRADGNRATFVVDGVRQFAKAQFPTTTVYGGDPHQAQLRLITCGGPFDRATRNYLDNTVVDAHLAGTGK